MSSTHIQLERDNVVSVQTQSMTARSSTRKGTRRNLGAGARGERAAAAPCWQPGPARPPALPLEEEEVEVVVFLGEEVAQDAGGVAAADLVG